MPPSAHVQPQADVPRATAGCLDLVADCGAKADGHDDTAAFNGCIAKASHAGGGNGYGYGCGCVTIPAGQFGVTGVVLDVSNVALFFDPEATVKPPTGQTTPIEGLIVIGSQVTSTPAHNVSVLGVGGQFTVDATLQGVINQKIGAIRLSGNVRNFVVGNVRTKMAYGTLNTTSKSTDLNTNALAMGNMVDNGMSYHPTDGHVFNITNTGSWGGYGLVQVQSAENILFEHLDSTGGVTLRMETGVQLPGSYVGNITGRDLTCRNGSSAFEACPHGQKNGDFFVSYIKSYSCFTAVNLVAGYIQSKNGQNVTTPGYFGNNSQVHGVVATFGTHAQCDALCTANTLFGSSCAACIYGENGAHPDSLGYKVDLQGFKAVGFPWSHDYTECAAFDRHKNPCSYWPSQGTSDQQ
eukprot:m.165179 g.165179  ORF g.165179 m.165179 type:complete len:409 (-) comp23984_c0_seq2:710-1936(-)